LYTKGNGYGDNDMKNAVPHTVPVLTLYNLYIAVLSTTVI